MATHNTKSILFLKFLIFHVDFFGHKIYKKVMKPLVDSFALVVRGPSLFT